MKVKLDPLLAFEKLQGREADFLKRVYSGGLAKYKKRLEAIDFTGAQNVLDAGSGYGQWSAALSRLNSSVFALELSNLRCEISDLVFRQLEFENIHVVNGSVTNLPFRDNYFDVIFSFSTIYQTDWKKSLNEFARVLRPGGKIYVNVNGFGWCLYNLLENPNPSADFNPRWHAFKTFVKTTTGGIVFPSADWVISPGQIRAELKKLGFDGIVIDGDGKIVLTESRESISFYKSKYFGVTNVFEVCARKY